MALGKAKECLAESEALAARLDDGSVREIFGLLIASVREIGIELERLVHPVIYEDYGTAGCHCHVRRAATGGVIITPSADCQVPGHHQENVDFIVNNLEEPHG